MSSSKPQVLLIDSGIGVLNIVQGIDRLGLDIGLVCCLDNANFPYGTKTEEQVAQYVQDLAMRLCAEEDFAAVVVACNTASTVVLPALRASLTIPVVGVVPAIKPAAHMSKNKCIGLLATKATVDRPYTKGLVDEFACDCDVVYVGSSKLVELAEAKLRGEKIDIATVRQEISGFWEQRSKTPDFVVLGCTHFPLIVDELSLAAEGRGITWVESSMAVAQRLNHFISTPARGDTSLQKSLVFSKDTAESRELAQVLQKDWNFHSIRYL
jgi:glutamate racemase